MVSLFDLFSINLTWGFDELRIGLLLCSRATRARNHSEECHGIKDTHTYTKERFNNLVLPTTPYNAIHAICIQISHCKHIFYRKLLSSLALIPAVCDTVSCREFILAFSHRRRNCTQVSLVSNGVRSLLEITHKSNMEWIL